jgi:hypothetical protein
MARLELIKDDPRPPKKRPVDSVATAQVGKTVSLQDVPVLLFIAPCLLCTLYLRCISHMRPKVCSENLQHFVFLQCPAASSSQRVPDSNQEVISAVSSDLEFGFPNTFTRQVHLVASLTALPRSVDNPWLCVLAPSRSMLQGVLESGRIWRARETPGPGLVSQKRSTKTLV